MNGDDGAAQKRRRASDVYNAETLLDVHARVHESLRRLIVFCGSLTDDELRRPLTGFGFPTILDQLEHTIGAEVYLMISDPGQTRRLRPADVIMRVVTHIFNHQGQVLAMCRTIGKPNTKDDLDYPVD